MVHQGANDNKIDRLGKTPLSIACYFGFVDIFICSEAFASCIKKINNISISNFTSRQQLEGFPKHTTRV